MTNTTSGDKAPPRVTRHTRPVFFDPSSLPWTRWVMPGTYFKLLNLNDIQGSFTMLLKVDADMDTPITSTRAVSRHSFWTVNSVTTMTAAVRAVTPTKLRVRCIAPIPLAEP